MSEQALHNNEISPVLVIELNGELSRTNAATEAVVRLCTQSPLQALRLPGWIAKGQRDTKIADHVMVSAQELPLNTAVIDKVKAARAAGQRTVLVSSVDQRQVTTLADELGIFDEAHGSTPDRNLQGPALEQFLVDSFGASGIERLAADDPVLAAPSGRARAALKALRPHQWLKNLLVFVPVLAAHDASELGLAMVGFLAFCLTASAIYLLNDLTDLSADRAHPRKCRRPFAAGSLSIGIGLWLSFGLLAAAFGIAFALGKPLFVTTLLLYLISTTAYSLWLKRKLIVDVLMLAGLYTLRIIAGGAAAAVILSPWILGFSMFVFLALAAVKRQAELSDQMRTGRKSAGRAYEVEDLPILRGMAMAASNAAVLVLALYISSQDVQWLYNRPQALWLTCPLLLYWLLRMIMKTHRGQMTDDPIVYAATDRVSLIVMALCGIVLLIATL